MPDVRGRLTPSAPEVLAPPAAYAPWVVGMAAVALTLIALGAWVRFAGHDTAVFRALNGPLGAAAPLAWSLGSVVGLGLSAVVIALALCTGQAPRTRHTLAALVWSLPVGGVLTHGLKALFDTPRPAGVLAPDQIVVVGQPLLFHSMPSGHSITAGVCLALALFASPRLGLRGAVAAFAVWVWLSRIAAGAHWPSDVLVGAGIGLLAGWISWSLAGRGGFADWLGGRRGQTVLGGVQLATGVAMVFTATGYPLALPLQWALGALGVAAGLRRWWLLFRGQPGGAAA